jgi:hypothetical protein
MGAAHDPHPRHDHRTAPRPLLRSQPRDTSRDRRGLVFFLAIQTAYLAKPGVDGFGGLNGNLAVRGANFAQYWLTQPPILVLCLGLVVVGGKGHDRVRHGTTGSGQEPRPLT